MVWIKRNLSMVISGVIALGLLGYGGWYFWSARQRNVTIEAEIEQNKQEIERYLSMAVTPSQSNLNNVRREIERLTQFNALAKKQFPAPAAPPMALNDESFKTLLQTTVNDLHQQARAVGIQIEPDYYFTFEIHKGSLQFRPETLRPLYDRLQEVKAVAGILVNARVNRIVGFRRAAVPNELPTGPGAAPVGAGDYLSAKPRAHAETVMMMWPYEVTFDCFTAQLGTVIEAIERIEQGIIIKALTSEIAPEAMGPRRGQQPGPGTRPTIERRRPGAPNAPNAPAAAAPTPSAALETVIDEKLLRVTLHLEVLRPDTTPPGGPGGPGGPGRRMGGPGGPGLGGPGGPP